MAGRLEGKVALIVGAGQTPGATIGNGRATALRFAQEGATLFLVDRRLKSAQETLAMVVEAGGRGTAHEADVTSEAACAGMIDACVKLLGRIDVLHNNVGLTAMGGPIEESLESWHHIMDTNVTAMFIAAKHVLPHMLKAGKGAIVNITSLAGIRVTPYPYSSYYASKAAVVHLTTHLGLQYAKQGIRANSIAPGLMNTPLIHQQIAGQYPSTEDMVRARDAMSPTGRMGEGWDIAHAAVFLASDDARFINGVVLPVDGGQHALMR